MLPRRLQIEFSQVIQRITDDTGGEITSEDIWKSFNDCLLYTSDAADE